MSRLDRMGTVLQKYDNIMIPKKKVAVSLRGGGISAKTGMHRKTDNMEIRITVPDDSIKSLVMAKGFNLHEMGHAKMTRIPKTLKAADSLDAYNLLEDQRIEWVLSNRYPGMRKYFVYLCKELVPVDDPRAPNWLWGRRFFLPYEVPEPKPEIKKVIDDYLVAKTQLEREALAREFAQLITPDATTSKDPQNYSKSKKETQEEQEASDTASKKQNEEKQEKKEKKEEKQPSPLEGLGQGEKEGEQTSSSDSPGGGQGKGEQEERPGEFSDSLEDDLQESLEEMCSEAIREVVTELAKPILDKKDQIQRKSGRGWSLFSIDRPMEKVSVSVDQHIVNSLYQVFRTVKVELQGNWDRHQRRGRLDLREAMLGEGNIQIFKKYKPSRLHDNKISLVILYDVSGSMNQNDPKFQELKSVASLTMAATKAGNEVCCIEFNLYANIIKPFNSPTLTMNRYGGGTDPKSAIRKFQEVRRQAKYPVVLIILTDGEFIETLVDSIEGVRLYKVLIGGHGRTDKSNWLKIKGMSTLPVVLKGIMMDVERRIKEKLLGRW